MPLIRDTLRQLLGQICHEISDVVNIGTFGCKYLAAWTRALKQKFHGLEPLQVPLQGPIANFSFILMLVTFTNGVKGILF